MEKQKMNNKGLSLVEVLIAIVILGIISIPILKSFTSSARINRDARRQENANTAASAVLEDFKSLSVERLVKRYQNSVAHDENTGIYEFVVANTDEGGKKYYAGVNGEEFYVRVRLDPAAYTDAVDGEGKPLNNQANNINSYSIPKFSNINASENFVLRDVLYKWDSDAKSTFIMTINSAGGSYDEKYIKKSIKITNSVAPKGTISETALEGTFVQRLSGTITYSYNGYPDYVKSFVMDDNEFKVKLGDDNIYHVSNGRDAMKDIYLFYTPFDIHSTSYISSEDTSKCKASDKIHIVCEYQEKVGSIEYSNIDTYLVQQNITYDNKDIYLDKSNVSVSVNSRSVNLSEYGTIDLSQHINTAGAVSVYSNIYGWEEYVRANQDRGNSLTSGGSGTGKNYLYSIAVDVWLDKASYDAGEEALVAVTSTKSDNMR